MKTLFALLFVVIAYSASAQKGIIQLEGTTWFKDLEGVEDLQDQNITFLLDGKILEELDPDSPGLDHHWEQHGKKVTISYNDNYAVYKGKIKGNTIVGKAKNVVGKTWTFKLTLVSGDGTGA